MAVGAMITHTTTSPLSPVVVLFFFFSQMLSQSRKSDRVALTILKRRPPFKVFF